jgi:phosphotransferase system IIA component
MHARQQDTVSLQGNKYRILTKQQDTVSLQGNKYRILTKQQNTHNTGKMNMQIN